MSPLFEELKRRKVIKVAVACLVAAWVLLQVAFPPIPADIHRVHNVSRATQLVLQFDGAYDADSLKEAQAKRLFDGFPANPGDENPVVRGTARFVPQTVYIGETLDWLEKYPGPATRQ